MLSTVVNRYPEGYIGNVTSSTSATFCASEMHSSRRMTSIQSMIIEKATK